MKRLLAIALVAACTRPAPPPAPVAVAVAAIGETFTLDSKILGERRVINVYVPPGDAGSAVRFPVLYMPDGGMKEDFPHASQHDLSDRGAARHPHDLRASAVSSQPTATQIPAA